MTQLNTILLQDKGSSGGMSSILMIVAMIVIFYFFMIRPQQKQRKKLKEQRDAMTVGDKVVTAGGIHGTIREMGDQTMLIEISKGVIIKVGKESVYPFAENVPNQKNA